MADCNEIIMWSIEMIMNMKAAVQLFNKNYIAKKCFNLNHFKCTHLSSTIWIVDIWHNEDKIIYVGIIGDGMGINQE